MVSGSTPTSAIGFQRFNSCGRSSDVSLDGQLLLVPGAHVPSEKDHAAKAVTFERGTCHLRTRAVSAVDDDGLIASEWERCCAKG